MCDQGSVVGLCMQDYKSLCTAVTTSWFSQNLSNTYWPHVTLITLHPCQMHPQCKFGDRRSAASRDTAHKYFCDRLKTKDSMWRWPTFCVQSGFASGSLHATTSVCVQRLRFVPPYLSQNLICPFWSLWPRKVGQAPGTCCIMSVTLTIQIWWPQVSKLQR